MARKSVPGPTNNASTSVGAHSVAAIGMGVALVRLSTFVLVGAGHTTTNETCVAKTDKRTVRVAAASVGVARVRTLSAFIDVVAGHTIASVSRIALASEGAHSVAASGRSGTVVRSV